jgi:hypothetical protein
MLNKLLESSYCKKGPGGSMSYAVWLLNNSYKQTHHQYGVGSRPAL